MKRKPQPQPIAWSQPLDQNGKVCRVRLYVDHTYLLRLLENKAANAKGGKAQLCHGAVVVKREK